MWGDLRSRLESEGRRALQARGACPRARGAGIGGRPEPAAECATAYGLPQKVRERPLCGTPWNFRLWPVEPLVQSRQDNQRQECRSNQSAHNYRGERPLDF